MAAKACVVTYASLHVPWRGGYGRRTHAAVSAPGVFAAAAISLHAGIALTMRNTALLSLAAIGAWLPFLDGPPTAASVAESPPPATTAALARAAASDGPPTAAEPPLAPPPSDARSNWGGRRLVDTACAFLVGAAEP